jgi:putative tryptophan/tyrosine transport system substrate-binding protein
MKRRAFITLLGGAAAWPLAARAQQPTRIARIGYLGLGPASAWSKRVEVLRAGLRNLGWVEGKNLVIEFRWADGVDQLPGLAAELVRMNVDVIFASSSTMVEPASKATKTIPIVFSNHADPIGTGHVASLNRPGGNITGLSELATDLNVKALEMLKEVVPQATRIGVLWNPTTPSQVPGVQAVKVAGEKLGLALHLMSAVSVEGFDSALASMARERVGGVFVVPSPLTLMERTHLAQLALRYRLPTMFAAWENVEAGGLMSYGVDRDDLVRRAALYIDKILKGAKPADLPVEQASKYLLIINVKTAKALGIDVPPPLLARADEVIE